jgi:hypothetical protein
VSASCCAPSDTIAGAAAEPHPLCQQHLVELEQCASDTGSAAGCNASCGATVGEYALCTDDKRSRSTSSLQHWKGRDAKLKADPQWPEAEQGTSDGGSSCLIATGVQQAPSLELQHSTEAPHGQPAARAVGHAADEGSELTILQQLPEHLRPAVERAQAAHLRALILELQQLAQSGGSRGQIL